MNLPPPSCPGDATPGAGQAPPAPEAPANGGTGRKGLLIGLGMAAALGIGVIGGMQLAGDDDDQGALGSDADPTVDVPGPNRDDDGGGSDDRDDDDDAVPAGEEDRPGDSGGDGRPTGGQGGPRHERDSPSWMAGAVFAAVASGECIEAWDHLSPGLAGQLPDPNTYCSMMAQFHFTVSEVELISESDGAADVEVTVTTPGDAQTFMVSLVESGGEWLLDRIPGALMSPED